LLNKISLSISLYRTFFHRLRHFPGPVTASLTRFWAFYTVNTGKYFKTVKELHEKHGDFVRVGPRELDICNLNAVKPVFGGTKPLAKGTWYHGTHMGDSSRDNMHMQIDLQPEEHAWKRRIWDVALSSKSLLDYEPRVLEYVDKLIQSLEKEIEKGGGIVDIGIYFSFFTFDVMGELA